MVSTGTRTPTWRSTPVLPRQVLSEMVEEEKDVRTRLCLVLKEYTEHDGTEADGNPT